MFGQVLTETDLPKTLNYNDADLAFSYHNVNHWIRRCEIQCGEYTATKLIHDETAFIQLNKKRSEGDIYGGKTRGWKFHISLYDIENNIEKGWDIIKKHLINAGVYETKVIQEDFRRTMSRDPENPDRSGREITIYAFKENRSVESWQQVFQAMTIELVKNQIIPGPLAKLDTPIHGSHYISYRHDGLIPVKNPIYSENDVKSALLNAHNIEVENVSANLGMLFDRRYFDPSEERSISPNSPSDDSAYSNIIITVPNQLPKRSYAEEHPLSTIVEPNEKKNDQDVNTFVYTSFSNTSDVEPNEKKNEKKNKKKNDQDVNTFVYTSFSNTSDNKNYRTFIGTGSINTSRSNTPEPEEKKCCCFNRCTIQ